MKVEETTREWEGSWGRWKKKVGEGYGREGRYDRCISVTFLTYRKVTVEPIDSNMTYDYL